MRNRVLPYGLFKSLLAILVLVSIVNTSRADIIASYKSCISKDELIEGKEELLTSLGKRIQALKLREASIKEKQRMLGDLSQSWSHVQEQMLPLSVASLVFPGVAVGKIAATFDYANIARTAYATGVISKEMIDYYIVGSMTTLLFGGVLLPATYSNVKYSVPDLQIRDCNNRSKIVVYDDYIELNGNFINRTKKNDGISSLLSKAEIKLVNQFEPGFWHFTKNALTFGLEEAARLSQIANVLNSQSELIKQELRLLEEDMSQIKNMKACSRVCDITVE